MDRPAPAAAEAQAQPAIATALAGAVPGVLSDLLRHPSASSTDTVLELQRRVGNQATMAWLEGGADVPAGAGPAAPTP